MHNSYHGALKKTIIGRSDDESCLSFRSLLMSSPVHGVSRLALHPCFPDLAVGRLCPILIDAFRIKFILILQGDTVGAAKAKAIAIFKLTTEKIKISFFMVWGDPTWEDPTESRADPKNAVFLASVTPSTVQDAAVPPLSPPCKFLSRGTVHRIECSPHQHEDKEG